jgi:hypothetical protein
MPRTYFVAPTSSADSHDVLVHPDPNLIVTVATEGGFPLPGVEVGVWAPDLQYNAIDSTDPSGTAGFAVPEGDYEIHVQKDGFVPKVVKATVLTGPAKTPVTVTLQPYEIEIVETSPVRPTQMVGHRVVLEVRSKPPGAVFSEVTWEISPETVRSYVRSQARADWKGLEVEDLMRKAVSFYWISGGAKTAAVTVKMGSAQKGAKKAYDVKVPTVEAMSAKTTEVSIGPLKEATRHLALVFQRSLDQPGIVWTFRAMLPTGGQGQISGTQLVNKDYRLRYEEKNKPTMEGHDTSQGEWWLDGTPEYEDSGAEGGGAGGRVEWTNSDTPGILLVENLAEARFDTKFRLYFMYRPTPATYDESDSIWVTLGRLDWFCRASTQRRGAQVPETPSNWSPPADVDFARMPRGNPSTELPRWTRFVPRVYAPDLK